MHERQTGLRCYRCSAPAASGQDACRECGLPLLWEIIHELEALDYLRLRLDRWRERGTIEAPLAERLLTETQADHRTLLERLVAAQGPPPVPYTQPVAHLGPDSQPVAHLGPDYGARVAPPELPVLAPPPVLDWEPAPPAAPPPRGPLRRPLLEVLLDVGTLRLMLYAGALLLAVGMLIYLRDTLRVQLQRPIVQAGLLAFTTLASLAVGATLVRRARDRFEPKLFGRAFLLLGALLVPLNPWFLERTGFIEDRGNAWIVGLLCFALYTGIAIGLGERIFVVLSYAAALLSGWLVTFRLTGGATPGAYALAILGVSLAYMHAELLVERTGKGRTWERFGEPLRVCAHFGIAVTLVFYTTVVRLAPPEIFAAFRHFDASGYTPWMGVAVAFTAAYAYFYSAWRRRAPQITYAAVASVLWGVALWLLASDAAPGVWLAACGGAALALALLGRALAGRALWEGPFLTSSRVLAWTGFAGATIPAVALATGFAGVHWFTTLGVALLLATFALDTAGRDERWAAFPLPALALLVVAYFLEVAGLERIYAHALLAVAAAALPAGANVALRGRENTRQGLVLGSTAVTLLLAAAAATWALVEMDRMPDEGPYRAIPVVLAVAFAFGLHGWYLSTAPIARYALYAFAAFFAQLGAILGAVAIRVGASLDPRDEAFLLLPVPYIFLAVWLVLRRQIGERAGEVANALRGAVWLGVFTASLFSLQFVWDAVFDEKGSAPWVLTYAALAAVPLATAFVSGAGIVASLECAWGTLLGLTSYIGLLHGLGRFAGDGESIVWYVGLALAPFGLELARRAINDESRRVAAPIGWIADAFALILGGVTLLVLVLASDVTGALLGASYGPGAFARIGHVAASALVCAYGLWRAAGRDAWARAWVLHSAVASLVTLLSLADNFSVSWSNRAIALPLLGVAAAAAARRLPTELDWLGQWLVLAGHASFWLSLAAACVLAAPEIGLSNPGLTEPVATFAVLAGCAWVLARLSKGAIVVVYALSWRGLTCVAYLLLGLRLGFHPWRESSFYTLPAGALLLAFGVFGARRDEPGAPTLLWLGSVVAAVPLLLHALDNRFLREVSPLGYDLATLTVGLALAAIGVLLQLKAPSVVGTLVFGADLFVVAFSQIRWAEVPVAVYSAAVGASLFGAAWLLLYRRDQLVRLRDRVRTRREAFQAWR
jgi:hypothetical protein